MHKAVVPWQHANVYFMNCMHNDAVPCLTSQQHARVSQGRICSDSCTCCHTETEAADPTCYLIQSPSCISNLLSYPVNQLHIKLAISPSHPVAYQTCYLTQLQIHLAIPLSHPVADPPRYPTQSSSCRSSWLSHPVIQLQIQLAISPSHPVADPPRYPTQSSSCRSTSLSHPVIQL